MARLRTRYGSRDKDPFGRDMERESEVVERESGENEGEWESGRQRRQRVVSGVAIGVRG